MTQGIIRRASWRPPFTPRGLKELSALVVLVVAALSTGACVRRDATYQREPGKSGYEPRRRRIESDAAAAQRTRELLSKPLTAESAVQIALLNNQGLRAVFEDLGAARTELVMALAVRNPEGDRALESRTKGDQPADLELDPTASLPRLVFAVSRKNRTNAEIDAATLAVTAAALEIAFQARTAFHRHEAARQIVALRRKVFDWTGATYAFARALHTEGRVSDLDLATEQAFHEDCRLLVSEAEEALLRARERLNGLMGIWGGAARWRAMDWLPEPDGSDVDVGNLEERALAASLDLAIASQRLRTAASAKNLAEVDSARDRASLRDRRRARAGGPAARSYGGARSTHSYQGDGTIALAESELERQRRLHSEITLQVRAQARMSANRLLVTRERVRFYRVVILPLRKRVVDETQLEFSAKAVGLSQLLRATRAQIESTRAYIETVRDYWIARAEIDQLLAGRLIRVGPSDDAFGWGSRASGAPPIAP